MMEVAKTNDMPYRYLGNSGLRVSLLSFGTMLMEYNEEDNQNWIECAKAAFKAGVNYFDSSEYYGFGQADRNLGEAIKQFDCKRSELVIAVKVFFGGIGPNRNGLSRKHIIEGTRRSLKNMDLDYCDLVFAHRPSYDIDLEEVCRAFNWLIKKGYARYWCTSVWDAEMITEAIAICEDLDLSPPIADQNEYNCLKRQFIEKDYRRLFEKYHYGTTVYSPLAGGVLTGKYNDSTISEGDRFSHDWVKDLNWNKYFHDSLKDNTLKILKGLEEYATELGVSQAQLALAWVLVNKDVSTCIVGATKLSQMESNLGAVKLAAEWSEEHEKRMAEILDNEPEPRTDFATFAPDTKRRPLRVSYDLPLGKLER